MFYEHLSPTASASNPEDIYGFRRGLPHLHARGAAIESNVDVLASEMDDPTLLDVHNSEAVQTEFVNRDESPRVFSFFTMEGHAAKIIKSKPSP